MFIWGGLSVSGDPVLEQEILLYIRQAALQAVWNLGNQAALLFGRMVSVFFVPNLDMFRAEQASSVVYKSISPEAGRGSSQRYLSAWGVWCQCKWVLASPCHEWPPSHLGSILLAEPATGGTICATKSKPNSSFPAAGKGRQRDSDSQAGWRVAHTLAPLWRRNGQ